MTLGQTLLYLAIGLFVLALMLFPDFRGKLKIMLGGFLNLFIEDRAKTPEGAEAVYQQAIEEAQKDYNHANDMLKQLSGQLSLAQRDLANAKEMFDKVSATCETLVKNGRIEEAKVKAEERESLLIEINTYTNAVNKLIPLVEDAKDINEKCEQALIKLKREKKQKIAELRLNQNLTKAYDNMDELKKNTATKKLLESVEEGLRTSQERATGAKVLHENKLSTKIERAEKTAKSLETNSYIEELRKKYNK